MSGVASNITGSPIDQFVMTSQVEFSPVNFMPNRHEKSFKLHNRPGEIKRTFRKSKGIAGAGFEDLRGMARERRKT